MEHETLLRNPPSLPSLYVRALLKRANLGAQPDKMNTLVLKTHIKQKQLKKYQALCQYSLDDSVIPAFYPQVLAFKLHLDLLLNKQLPFPAMGLVHKDNQVEYFSPIHTNDSLTIKVSMSHFTQNTKGMTCVLLTQAYVDDKLKWQANSTYFYKLNPPAPVKKTNPSSLQLKSLKKDQPHTIWSLKANLGRQYAKITGDLNPIHLYALTAKLFGFKQSIIHGMCMAAKAVAQAQAGKAGFPLHINIEFSKPIYLPNKVAFVQTDNHFDIYPFSNDGILDTPMMHGKFETNPALLHSKAQPI